MTGYRIQSMVRDGPPTRARQPRKKKQSHLAFIRELGCAVCAKKPVDAAHLRSGERLVDKPITGAGTKPDDRWVIPLCGGPEGHHMEQHHFKWGELAWWHHRGIVDPFRLALALYSVSGDIEQAERILSAHRASVREERL